MFIENLTSEPIRICNAGGYIAMARVICATLAPPVWIKFYNLPRPPTAADVPDFSQGVPNDGTPYLLPVTCKFGSGGWIAASTSSGASLDNPGDGVEVNIAGEDTLHYEES